MPCLAAASLTLCGCLGSPRTNGPDSNPAAQPPVGSDQPVEPPGEPPSGSVFTRPMQRLVVEFTVHRISAPKGTFAQEEGVWKLVSGTLPSAEATLRLAANGIRAAVGQESDRAALLTELTRLADIRMAVDHVTPDVARMVDLELGPCLPRQAIFYYDGSGGIHGCDFVQAKARFKMTFEVRLGNLQEVWLELAPEIEEPAGPRKWVKTPEGEFREVEEERKTTFGELSFSAKVQAGGFLLLGPKPAVYDQPLLARPFFLEESAASSSEGEPEIRESIYVISPIVRSYTAAGR